MSRNFYQEFRTWNWKGTFWVAELEGFEAREVASRQPFPGARKAVCRSK